MPDEIIPDEVLLRAVDVARTALLEITPPTTVGAPAGHTVEGERVLSLLFENTMPGYPGWYWTVSLSRDEGSDDVNVLETELMPGESALLAPDWVPWADRLADYQAQKKAEREAAEAAGETAPDDEFAPGADDELDQDDDLDEADDLDDDGALDVADDLDDEFGEADEALDDGAEQESAEAEPDDDGSDPVTD